MTPPTKEKFEADMLARHKHLLAQATQLTNDGTSAEDLVQDTFVRALSRRHQFDGVNMGGWLRVIMRSIFCNNRLLHANRMEHIPIEHLERTAPEIEAMDSLGGVRLVRYPATVPHQPPAQEGVVALGDNLRKLEGAMPLEDFQALVLTYGEGNTYQETADAMGASIHATRDRMLKGRALMRRLKEMEMDE